MSELKIIKGGTGLPSRVAVFAPPGVGKTSFGAAAPKPIFLMSKGENGLETLIDLGVVPETPHFPECQTWQAFTAAIDYLIAKDLGYKSLVIDTVNGAAQLLVEKVTRENFSGKADEFLNYGRGYGVAEPIWTEFVAKLGQLRSQRKMAVILLAHSKIKSFKNPDGEDYDRYVPDMNELLWGRVDRWADVVLFANHETLIKSKSGKGKSTGRRWLYTTRTAAYDAKNRCNLPDMIPMDPDGQAAFRAFAAEMGAARRGNPYSTGLIGPAAPVVPLSQSATPPAVWEGGDPEANDEKAAGSRAETLDEELEYKELRHEEAMAHIADEN